MVSMVVLLATHKLWFSIVELVAVDVIFAFAGVVIVVVSIAVAVADASAAIVLRVYLLAIRNKIPMFKRC